MSISSSLALLKPLDGQSWRDIQGFRMNKHGPDRELCDLEVQDHIQGVCQRKIDERQWDLHQQAASDIGYRATITIWKKVECQKAGTCYRPLKEVVGKGESHAEAILACYVACLQELA